MPILAAEEAEKVRAFEQRMQLEGAAAFAAGPAPWEDWDDVGTLGTYRIWRDSRRHGPSEQAPRQPLTTRLLTGLAQLAVLVLLVGTAGVYLSALTPDPRLAQGGVQPPPIVLADRPHTRAATPVIRHGAGEPVSTADATIGTTVPAEAAADAQAAPVFDATRVPPVAVVVPLQLEVVPSPSADVAEPALAATLDELPGTAAGPVTGPRTTPDITPAREREATANAGPDSVAADMPYLVTLHSLPADTLPGKPTARPSPLQAALDLSDTWVVNLASYNHESMARRKLAAFRDKGVNAELVKVTVKGRHMIRIRTTGYRSRHEASEWAGLLEERLGLEGAWVARYEPGEE